MQIQERVHPHDPHRAINQSVEKNVLLDFSPCLRVYSTAMAPSSLGPPSTAFIKSRKVSRDGSRATWKGRKHVPSPLDLFKIYMFVE